MPEAGKAVSLEVVEIELALGAQDIVADGFEGALRKAADLVGGEVIFNIRAPENSDQQRIAAISVSDGTTDQTVFVMLGNDGTSLTVTPRINPRQLPRANSVWILPRSSNGFGLRAAPLYSGEVFAQQNAKMAQDLAIPTQE